MHSVMKTGGILIEFGAEKSEEESINKYNQK